MEPLDLSDELCALLDELPRIRSLPRGDVRRSAWLERKHQLMTRLAPLGPDPTRLALVEDTFEPEMEPY